MLKRNADDGRTLHEPGSARAAPRAAPATPRPAALREPAPGAGGRATHRHRPKKRVFCGNLAVLRVCCWQRCPWRPRQVFCPSRPFAAGRGVRAAGLGVESAEIAVPAQRIRSFPRPSKGNSAPLKAVGVSRRYKQRMRLFPGIRRRRSFSLRGDQTPVRASCAALEVSKCGRLSGAWNILPRSGRGRPSNFRAESVIFATSARPSSP